LFPLESILRSLANSQVHVASTEFVVVPNPPVTTYFQSGDSSICPLDIHTPFVGDLCVEFHNLQSDVPGSSLTNISYSYVNDTDLQAKEMKR